MNDTLPASPRHRPDPHHAWPRGRPRIVILGGGFGGAYCALGLEKALRSRDAEVLLLDHHNYFIFYPFLVEAGIGSLHPRNVVVAIRPFLRAVQFRMAAVRGVDLARQEVSYEVVGAPELHQVRYDHLVLALGSVTNLPPVPGLRAHGFELKSLTDAVALRDRSIQLLELADATSAPRRRRALLHLVVVGGNFTGTEVAGQFQALMRQAARLYPNVDPRECRVTLVERGESILHALGPDLSSYATHQLRRRGIDVRLRTSAVAVEEDRVVLDRGEEVEAYTTIWAAGIAPSPLVRALPLPVDERGYIRCAPDLRVEGLDNVWSVGDCSVHLDSHGRPYPATAQHAVREGKHLAHNLARVLRGRDPKPFVYRSEGSIAAIGCRTGVAKVFGIKLSGFLAWFVFRTVYLFKIPGWKRKARVAVEWTADLFFGIEYVQLGIHRVTPPGPAGTKPPETPETPAPPARAVPEAVLPADRALYVPGRGAEPAGRERTPAAEPSRSDEAARMAQRSDENQPESR